MKALVTGATGFLGSTIARALAARGDQVSVLVRAASNLAPLQGTTVEKITGDVQDKQSLMQAAQGKDVVIHCAGKVEDWGERKQFYQVNVEGTRNLLEAAAAAGTKHFIHTSSLTVVEIPRSKAIDEATPYTTSFFDPYTETKVISEKLVLDFYKDTHLPVTIIRPGIIWGPGDTTILPRLERLARKGLIFNIGRGDNVLCLSFITNLVDAFLLAADTACPECEIYNITDQDGITSSTFFAELAAAVGVKKPSFSLPFWFLYGIAWIYEAGGRLIQLSDAPLITRLGLYLWGTPVTVDITKAQQKLGYRQRIMFAQGMQALASWYRETYLRPA